MRTNKGKCPETILITGEFEDQSAAAEAQRSASDHIGNVPHSVLFKAGFSQWGMGITNLDSIYPCTSPMTYENHMIYIYNINYINI